MMHFTAQTATANHIPTLNTVDVEFQTTTGEQVIVSLPQGAEDQFRDDVESAALDAEHARNRGAAYRLDAGAA